MFLEMLEEKERNAFMNLAYLAMECDDDIAPEELEMLDSYKHECKLKDFQRSMNTVQECLEAYQESSRAHRKIVLLELMGIWAADNEWKDSELEMMEHVARGLAIPPSRMNRLKRWSKELRSLVADGYALITED